jgi:hypothetical protein
VAIFIFFGILFLMYKEFVTEYYFPKIFLAIAKISHQKNHWVKETNLNSRHRKTPLCMNTAEKPFDPHHHETYKI